MILGTLKPIEKSTYFPGLNIKFYLWVWISSSRCFYNVPIKRRFRVEFFFYIRSNRGSIGYFHLHGCKRWDISHQHYRINDSVHGKEPIQKVEALTSLATTFRSKWRVYFPFFVFMFMFRIKKSCSFIAERLLVRQCMIASTFWQC